MQHMLEDALLRYDLWLKLLIAYLVDVIIYLNKRNETFSIRMVLIIKDIVLHRQ